jgi:hypothetical protein
MFSIKEIKCQSEVEFDQDQQDEEEDWEGCCEDVLMDDEFYEREYCD